MANLLKNTTKTMLLTVSFVLLSAIVAMQPAAAKTPADLTRYVSSQNEIVVGINLKKVRSTPFYDDFVGWVKAQSQGMAALKSLEEQTGLELEKDFDALVVAFKSQATQMPQAKTPPTSDFAAALAGTFKKAQIIKALDGEDTLEKSTASGLPMYQNADVSILLPADGLVLVSMGDAAYRKTNIATFTTQKGSIEDSKILASMTKKIDTASHIWMSGDTRQMPAQAGSPSPQSLGLEVDLSAGLGIQLFAAMKGEAEATQAATSLEMLRSQGGNNPFVAMLGAKPLIDNMKVKVSGSDVAMQTEMNAQQFSFMVKSIATMAMSQGLGGAPSSTPNSSGKVNPSGGGVEADFN